LTSLRVLAEEFQRWMDAGAREGGWSDVMFTGTSAEDGASTTAPGPGDAPRALRARFARPPSPQSGEFVIFLEDRNALEERAQQLKLAAMGRLTASIAHEIRNPLAAISNASQLLAEEADNAMQRRLAEIVRENTGRLNRLVEDVLRVARRDTPLSDAFDLQGFVRDWVEEFIRDRTIAEGTLIVTGFHGPELVKFEQSHLRQVLFNLVDNALRYCSRGPASVEIYLESPRDQEGRVKLWIVDDGAGVAPADRAAMFEPFFTTHARGTGLGLYLAREFCMANHADLAYELLRRKGAADHDAFVIRFARGEGEGDAAGPSLDTMPVAVDLRRELS